MFGFCSNAFRPPCAPPPPRPRPAPANLFPAGAAAATPPADDCWVTLEARVNNKPLRDEIAALSARLERLENAVNTEAPVASQPQQPTFIRLAPGGRSKTLFTTSPARTGPVTPPTDGTKLCSSNDAARSTADQSPICLDHGWCTVEDVWRSIAQAKSLSQLEAAFESVVSKTYDVRVGQVLGRLPMTTSKSRASNTPSTASSDTDELLRAIRNPWDIPGLSEVQRERCATHVCLNWPCVCEKPEFDLGVGEQTGVGALRVGRTVLLVALRDIKCVSEQIVIERIPDHLLLRWYVDAKVANIELTIPQADGTSGTLRMKPCRLSNIDPWPLDWTIEGVRFDETQDFLRKARLTLMHFMNHEVADSERVEEIKTGLLKLLCRGVRPATPGVTKFIEDTLEAVLVLAKDLAKHPEHGHVF